MKVPGLTRHPLNKDDNWSKERIVLSSALSGTCRMRILLSEAEIMIHVSLGSIIET